MGRRNSATESARSRFLAIWLGLLLSATVALPASALETTRWVDVEAKPDAAWRSLGDYCGVAAWHPDVKGCTVRRDDGVTVRTLTLADGGTVAERLVDWNDRSRSYTYRLVEGPLPIVDHQSSIYVRRHGDGSRIYWSGSYAAAPNVPGGRAWSSTRQFYDAGLQALAGRLKVVAGSASGTGEE